jgi:DNA repair protein RadC
MARFTAQPRRDMKPLAKLLIKTFGSFAEVVHAPETRLQEVDGAGEASITLIQLIAATPAASPRLRCHTHLLSSWSSVIDYLPDRDGLCRKEQFRLPFLDKRRRGHPPTDSLLLYRHSRRVN